MGRHAVGQLLEAVAQDLVIVPAACVDRHNALTRALQAGQLGVGPAVFCAARQVVHARSNHTHRAGHQLGRTGAFQPVMRHVAHATVETVRQPC